jgi:hypothetical protein
MVETTRPTTSRAPGTRLSPKRYSVGVDLGQASDPTAIAVIEKSIVPPETAMFSPVGRVADDRLVEGDTVYDLVYLKRPKLHTPYDVIARHVAELCLKLEPKGAFDEIGQLTLAVDGTGVGRGVVDMLNAELRSRSAKGEYVPRVDFRPVTVTGSNSTVRRPRSRRDYWSVPKKDLVFPAVTAFQQHKLRIAKDVTDKAALVRELTNYRRNINIATGNLSFEPWRESDHDDLLFAVALALWGWTQGKMQWALRTIA